MARSLTSICLLQAALKSGVHRARFGVRQTPGLSQVRNHNTLFERRKESKYDHSMRSPHFSSLNLSNPGASKIVLSRVPLLTVSTRTVSRLWSFIWMLYHYPYFGCNLLYVFSFTLVVSICSAFVKYGSLHIELLNAGGYPVCKTSNNWIRKQFFGKKMSNPIKSQNL